MFMPFENLLKCSTCENFLSIFPIHYEEENKLFTCGRCPIMKTSTVKKTRQTAYEALAQFVSFPCRFRQLGCMEHHVPSVLVKHENICGYGTYFCPLLSLDECDWMGPRHLFYNHCLINHKNFITENLKFKIHINQNWEKHYIFWCDTKPFFAYIRHQANLYGFCLCIKYLESVQEEDSYVYKVSLHFKKQIYEFPTQLIQNTTSIMDNAVQFHIFTKPWRLRINSSVVVAIKVFKLDNIIEGSPAPTENARDFLKKIECSACYNYMIPPIIQCNTGHSFCTRCSGENNVCRICEKQIGNSRNFLLEELTRFIKYPCKYEEDGCNFKTSLNEIKDHERNCRYRLFACLIENCCWEGNTSKLTQHLRTNHTDELFNNPFSNKSIFFKFVPGVRKVVTSLESNYGVIFKQYFLYDGVDFFFSVQRVDTMQNSCQYMFELRIFNNSGEELLVRKICSPLTESDPAQAENNSYIRLSEHSMRAMIENGQLTYSFKIFRK